MIIGITPVRISFAGGGTDLPEYYNQFNGNVVSTTINQFTYAIVHPSKDNLFQVFSPDLKKHFTSKFFGKIAVEDGNEIASSTIKYLKYKTGINTILFSDVAAGSGLGGSSSLMVNLLNTLLFSKREKWNKTKLAETAYFIARNILHWPLGRQDEYITSFGGFNHIKFSKQKTTVSPIKLNNSTKKELESNLLLFFMGTTRKSAEILIDQIKRINDKDPQTISALHSTNDLGILTYESLKNSDIEKFAELLNEGWNLKRKFSTKVSNPKIDRLYKKAFMLGASGGKLTGAGGGGHLLLYCEKNKQKKIINYMESKGLKQVKFEFYNSGPKVLDIEKYISKGKINKKQILNL